MKNRAAPDVFKQEQVSQTSLATRLQTPCFYRDQGGRCVPKVDFNRSDARTLASLPGISPPLAQAIVEERSKEGFFQSCEAIKSVKGFSLATFQLIEDICEVD